MEPYLSKIDALFDGDSVEAIVAKLKAESSEWSLKLADTILKMSPTSLKITHKQLELGADMDLQDCLKMEYRLSQRCCEGHDFVEGIDDY